ncbi:hypothetical protein CHS0354_027619 [Potamilus streckersoni]|uniref:Metalloendopeptidase n=1 Tax=Potamilus streckersoni TaxID=2493646 RepID=A0AAE0SE90_9BIVA|nr:hypothetical protein CHS0354_027619 [Potamilus streckersoni]
MEAVGGLKGDLNLKTINGGILMELDMLLSKQQYYSLYEQPNSTLIRNKRKAIRTLSGRWTNREIPYRFYRGHFDQRDQYMIRQAMTEWERYTCLRFREATSSDTNVVVFRNGYGCYSQLGMAGGEQVVSLSSNGCRNKETYLHEIGHVIGLVHEHQLPNRDDYVEIILDNVYPSYRNQFSKYSSQEVDQMNLPYDYSSIMHYGATAFSKDGKSKTIRVKYTGNEAIIGNVKQLSSYDVEIVNKMYKCSGACNNEYQDNTMCDTWAKAGECNTNNWMIQNCAKSCGRCSGREMTTTPRPRTKVTTQISIGGCKNLHSDIRSCDAWAKAGYCTTSQHVRINCAKSCGTCSGQGPLTSSNARLSNVFVKTKSETSIISKVNKHAPADDPNDYYYDNTLA